MDERTADRIRQRSAWETERKGYPEGFPALPPVPAARYGDPAFFALEQRHVFGSSWLFAALDDELRDPGDVLGVEHLATAVLLARGQDGVIRGFHNTCTHRGTPLVARGPGHVARRIVCPYHHWSFELTGELASYPEKRDFRGLDRSCLGLRPVRCETFGGSIFVNFDPDAAPLQESLGRVFHELDDEIGERAPGTGMRLIRKVSYDLPCNWKVAADANLETYHVNALHRNTASEAIDPRTTTIALYAQGHARMFLKGRDPAAAAALPLPRFPHVSPLAGEGVLSYGIFPNVALVLAPYMMFTVNAWPVGPSQTRYEVCYMGAAPETDETKAVWDLLLGFNGAVIEEDVSVLAGIQRSIDAGNLEALTLGYMERRIYHLHEEVDRRIGATRIPQELRVQPVLEPFLEG